MKHMLKKMALSGIANLFAERMPFNKLIGMQVTHYDFDKVELRIKMDDKLIGNPFHNILHGGVTASLLDVAGGMIVAASCIDELEDFSPNYLKGDGNTRAFMDLLNGDWLHFNDSGGPQKSVNFVTAHDGFTMFDLVSYNTKDNGQPYPFGPSDGGSDDNLSWDSGG